MSGVGEGGVGGELGGSPLDCLCGLIILLNFVLSKYVLKPACELCAAAIQTLGALDVDAIL